MNITLNKNSWHFKMYSYVVSDTPPRSLCPYFWSLVAILIFSPIILCIFLVQYFHEKYVSVKNRFNTKKIEKPKTYVELETEFQERKIKYEKYEKFKEKILNILITIIQWCVLPLLGLLIIVLIGMAVKTNGMIPFLVGCLMGLTFTGVILGILLLFDNYGEKVGGFFGKVFNFINPFKWTISKMVAGMVYSFYKKACPLIQWEGDNEAIKNNE